MVLIQCTSVSLQHWLAWSLITISGLFADTSLSVLLLLIIIIIIIIISLIVPSFLLTNA